MSKLDDILSFMNIPEPVKKEVKDLMFELINAASKYETEFGDMYVSYNELIENVDSL